MKTKDTVRLISIILLLIVSVLLIYYFHIIRDTGEVFSHYFYMPIIISILWWRKKGLLTTLFLIVVLCTSNLFRETPNIIHDFYRSIPFIIVSIIAYSINEKLIKSRIKSFQTLADLQKSKVGYEHLFTMLRLMCDNLPELIWAKDLEGKYIFVNKSCCENLLNAKNTDEPIGKTDLYFAEREKNSHLENPDYNTFGDICTNSDLKTIESKKQTNSDETGYIKGVYTILNVSKAPFWYNNNIIGTIGCARDVTIERKYEKILTESEERFRSLYENTTIGLYRTTPDGKILLANPALVNMLGYNNFDELARLNVEKEGFESGYSRHTFLEKIEKEGEIKGLESAWAKKDGTTIFVCESAKVIYDSNNQIIYYEGTVEDITQRKKIENALEQSEEKYRTMIEQSNDMIWTLDIDGNLTFFNKRSEEITGHLFKDWEGKSFAPLIVEEDLPIVMEVYQKTLKGESQRYEVRIKRVNEQIIILSVNTAPILKNNKVVGTVSFGRDITARKQAEDSLKETRDYLDSLIRYANAPIIVWDTKGRITRFNRAFEHFTGFNSENVLGKKLDFLFPKDRFEEVMVHIRKATSGERLNTVEIPVMHKDGSIKILLSNSAPIYVPDSKTILSIIVQGQDITERKQANQKLRELNQAIEQSLEGIAVANMDGEFIFVNQAWAEMHGYRVTDLIGKPTIMLDSPEDRRDFPKVLEDIKKKGFWRGELRRVRKDYSSFPSIMTSSLMTDDKNRPIGIVGVCLDITERKRAEQIQKVLYNISNAVITTDNLKKLISLIQKELGTIIDTTNFYVALYDNKTDTLSLPFFVDEKDEFTTFPAGKTLTYYVIKTQEPLFATKEIIKKLEKSGDVESFGTNSEIWLGVPLKIEGEVTGVLAIQSYSDENAFNESDMRMLEFVSDQISISIDRKKTEEDLIKSKEKAEENDRLKTAFLTNMSHEIRTPMNGIIGFADLLKKANFINKEEYDYYANIIVDSSKQLLNIVNDILDISKIETGQIDLFEEEISVNKIISETFSFFELKAKEKNLKLNVFKGLSDKEATIKTDQSKLKQVLFNLVSNAFKFTEKGSIDFGYHLKNNELEFYVKDSGIGIAKKYHKKIFDRFIKAENITTELYGGTGLGLAICTGLVGKMGGKIWVESEKDKGAEFYFTIPYKTSTQTKVSKLQENITESDLADYTILVVEDETNSAIYLREILSNRKIKQLLAKDGKQAIEMFKKNHDIDLILMDIKLPVMDGYTATREIKKIKSDIPVIAQTAYAMFGDKEKALKAGCDDYISKPISEENLISLLKKYLKK